MAAISRKKLASVVFGAAATLVAGAAIADDNMVSNEEYMNSCAVCHGVSGRGDGDLVRFLSVKPTDLTTLSRNNDGEFPFQQVFQVIDGRSLVSGHGPRDMPVWGRRYQEEIGEKYGPYGGEIAIRARVLELVYYVQSIQVK